MYRRDDAAGARRGPPAAGFDRGTGRSAPAGELVQRQIPYRSQRPAGQRTRVQAVYDGSPGRRPARYRRDARRPPQYPLSSGLYRLAGAHARLARRRPAELGRPCRGGASVRHRLFGRSAVERRRSRQELVRAGQVAALVPNDSGRQPRRDSAAEKLRRSRLLKNPEEIKHALFEQARACGFDAAGVTRPDAVPEAKARLERFIADGAHGDMVWMASTATRRASPAALWPDVRSVIMLGMNYGPDEDPLAILTRKDRAAISTYAKGDVYHELIKSRLKQVARWLVEKAGGDVKVFVDTAAVMEKPLAASAGLGWQGKHTNLVSRDFGSWLFLGSIFTTLNLPHDEAVDDSCGTCRACLDACPTAAFPEPYRLDARRCISYLTIEHKGPIPREFRPLMGNRIYGCDDCLAVCPWNKFASAGREAKLAARDVLRAPTLAELSRLDDAQFRMMFSKTSIKRTGRDRFVRNVLNAIGNSGDVSLAVEAERLLNDDSPLVRGAAVWALSRLLPKEKFSALKRADDDSAVQEEWSAALS